MKGDKECDEHNCEALKYCKWYPDQCQGKPWVQNELKMWQRILRPACFGKEALFPGCAWPGQCPFSMETDCVEAMLVAMKRSADEFHKVMRNGKK